MRTLQAGPLTLSLDGPDLRSIRYGDREVLRRIYVAVRDRNWDTIPGVIGDVKIQVEKRRTTVSFPCRHQRGEIDFRWDGLIQCEGSGAVRFEMNGRAESTFLRNRIGICVHHPLRETVGRKCTVETSAGRRDDVFPFYVAPHQPFLELKSIAHDVEPGVRAEVRFEGDLFEMEDHRNWTDGGFKIYSTPLSLPFPVEVKAGSEIRQAVEVRLTGGEPAPPAPRQPEIRKGGGAVRALPALGFGLGPWPDAGETERIRALRPAHLRLDCEIWSDCSERMRRAASLGLPLELALHLSDNGDSELRAHLPVIRGLTLARVLVFHRGSPVTPPRWLALARSLLGDRVIGGTNSYFAELNRNRPADAAGGACFSVNPQVHAFDNLSLVENLEAQAHAVESARMFLPGGPIVVSPVTLLPRFNPNATVKTAGPAEPPADPRQREAFCAAWTIGSVKYLAESGAASVTYYEAAGPRGLLSGGSQFPVYRVFEAIAPFAGGECIPLESTAPLCVLALALRKEGRSRVILANVSGEPQQTQGWLARRLAPWEVTVIDGALEAA
jgi:hypothetical protein